MLSLLRRRAANQNILEPKRCKCGMAEITEVLAPVVAENPSEQESRCLPHIAVVQAANLGKLDHPAQLGSLDDPRLRRVAVQRQVTA